MTEVEGVGRRRSQLLDDLRYRRRYWEVKEEAEDRKRWKRQFMSRKNVYIQVIFQKSMDQLRSSASNNNKFPYIDDYLLFLEGLLLQLKYLQH